jgi:hypothetical protein
MKKKIITYIISPNFSLVCIKAQLLWSLVVTARLLLGDAFIANTDSAFSTFKLLPRRTIGDEPRRLDMCRPATLPIILKFKTNFKKNSSLSLQKKKSLALIANLTFPHPNLFLEISFKFWTM